MSDMRASLPSYPQTEQAAPQSVTSLDMLKRMFEDSRTLTQDARKESNIDRDYYDGFQYTKGEKDILKARGQPEILINRYRRGIDGVMGVVEQGKTDPRAYMRNPPDPQTGGNQPNQTAAGLIPGQAQQQPQQSPDAPDAADVASMTLRFIADTNHFQPLKMDVLENGLIEGTGACIIECIGQDVKYTQIRWEEYFYDPRCRRHDFADKRYDGVAKWMYADQLSALYADKKQQIEDYCTGTTGRAFDESWEDRPVDQLAWIDSKQKRLMVVEMYYLEASQWWRCVFCGDTILEQAVSPYKDDKNQTIDPIESWSAYIDRNNNRYGIGRDMRGPQDGLNMSHSKRLHIANTRQIQPIDANTPPIDVDIARKEAAKPDGVIPPGWKLVDTSPMAQLAIEGMQEFKLELERMSPNPAILGRQGADSSGRAIQARQQAGMTEMARVLGRFTDWELRVHKQGWNRARQFWTDPKWIRVTNDEGAPQYVRVNDPQPPQIAMGQMGMQQIQPSPPKNHIAKMDVDIVVDAVPDTATLQQEIWQDFVELAKARPQEVPLKLLIQMSPLPKKRELIDALEKAQGEAAQANQQAMAVQMAGHAADVAKTQSETEKNQAQAGLAEVQTVTAALEGHVKATAAAQLPHGYTIGADSQHLPIQAPPPGPTGTGVGVQP